MGSNPTPGALRRLIFLILRTDDVFLWQSGFDSRRVLKMWKSGVSDTPKVTGCLAQWQRIALVVGWSGFDSRRNQISRLTDLLLGWRGDVQLEIKLPWPMEAKKRALEGYAALHGLGMRCGLGSM